MELIEDVGKFLDAQGVATLRQDLFLLGLPAQSVDAITVLPVGGPGRNGNPIGRPAFQILIRRKNKKEGLEKATAIHTLLDNAWNVLTERLGRILADSEPGNYYLDESDNFVFTLNFTLVQAPGSPGGS